MNKFILSLDQGTTSTRALLIDQNGKISGIAQKELTQIYPDNGWVEHNPNEILNSQIEVIDQVISENNIETSQIAAIGITNQRETAVVWDKDTGAPIYNAIVWQDNRTTDICEDLKNKNLEKEISDKTGLLIAPYFSATKISWILNNVKSAKEKAKSNKLLFGTIDSWLIWNLTEKQTHATDFSNASRTMLFNINKLEWDTDILNELGIPKSMLPKVLNSSANFGNFNYKGHKIPIYGVLGDQQASLFGQKCFDATSTKNTYGTGCFILMNTSEQIIKSKNGLLSTIAWGINGKISYALEGSIFIAGAGIQWLRDELKIINSSEESEKHALKSSDKDNLFVVPAFNGLGAPYWDMYAKGLIIGITRDTNKSDIIKATLDSIAYQTKDVLTSMEKDTKSKINLLKVDGGASNNNYLMQFQSNILGVKIEKPQNTEVTALGAAYIAGLLCSFWDINHLKNLKYDKENFNPKFDSDKINKLYQTWNNAVKRSMNWIKD